MSTPLATLICTIGILGLFYLDRDKSIQTSKALWIPVIWVLINASRPVTLWLGVAQENSTASQLLEGSPLDRLISSLIIAAGFVVLMFRSSQVLAVLRKNWPILAYFGYCLLSVVWSDYSEVAFKRWIKAIGDLIVVLVVVTEAQPVAAIKRLITRVGFILLPVSVLMIKYYVNLGRTYDTWSGEPANCGVAVTKNMLGVLTFIIALGAVWMVLRLLRDKNQPNRGRHFIAQGALLAFGISLLSMAHSATSGICFSLGTLLIVVTSMERFRKNPRAIHILVVTILLLGGAAVLFGNEAVASAVGRKTNLTGRTEIWQVVIPMAPNPIFGAGFDSFWLGDRIEKVWSLFPSLYLNEAHNGYVETYLNLGIIGLFLIVVLLLSGYRNAVNSFRYDEPYGTSSLMLAYIFTGIFYSITEAGFRALFVMWTFLVLAIVSASNMANVPAKSATSEADERPAHLRWRETRLSTTSRHG
jgi:exopolysaccharide production protein ExoQ